MLGPCPTVSGSSLCSWCPLWFRIGGRPKPPQNHHIPTRFSTPGSAVDPLPRALFRHDSDPSPTPPGPFPGPARAVLGPFSGGPIDPAIPFPTPRLFATVFTACFYALSPPAGPGRPRWQAPRDPRARPFQPGPSLPGTSAPGGAQPVPRVRVGIPNSLSARAHIGHIPAPFRHASASPPPARTSVLPLPPRRPACSPLRHAA